MADVAHAEGERQAAAILAVNLGSHGKKHDIERAIRDLTGTKQKSMTADEALQFAAKKPTA